MNWDTCRDKANRHDHEDRLLERSGFGTGSSNDRTENEKEQNEQEPKPDDAQHDWMLRRHGA